MDQEVLGSHDAKVHSFQIDLDGASEARAVVGTLHDEEVHIPIPEAEADDVGNFRWTASNAVELREKRNDRFFRKHAAQIDVSRLSRLNPRSECDATCYGILADA